MHEIAGDIHASIPPLGRLNPEEEKELQDKVRAAHPDIFWVGLSTPKQEKFMAEYLSQARRHV